MERGWCASSDKKNNDGEVFKFDTPVDIKVTKKIPIISHKQITNEEKNPICSKSK